MHIHTCMHACIYVTAPNKIDHLAAFFKIDFFCVGKSPIFSLFKDIFTSAIGLSIA